MHDMVSVHDYALNGQCEELSALLRDKPELVLSRSELGDTPLHYACWHKHLDAVELLIAHGAPVNARGDFGRTPLHYAIWEGLDDVVPIVAVLMSHGADPAIEDIDGVSPIDFAKGELTEGLSEVLRLMGDWQEPIGTSIHELIRTGHAVEVYHMLNRDHGLINVRDEHGNTPLHVACLSKQMGMLGGLAVDKPDVNAKGSRGRTSLHCAVTGDHTRNVQIVSALLADGADPSVADDDGLLPADLARQEMTRGLDQVLELLENGPFRPWPAGENGDREASKNVERLIDAFLLQEGRGAMAFTEAARWGLKDAVQAMIDDGMPVDAGDEDEGTPLMYAASGGQTAVVRLLVKNGANVNAVHPRTGFTPLLWLLYAGHSEKRYLTIAKMLIDAGARVDIVGKNGETALAIASERRSEALVALLEAGLKREGEAKDGEKGQSTT